ncbi:MAG: hypothetical protein ABFE08_23165 [Armatimonadia bacterium]
MYTAQGAVNGFDILLWLGFMYVVAPRILGWKPRKRRRVVKVVRRQRVAGVPAGEMELRAA